MQLKKQTRLATAIVTILLTTPLWATNGYFTHGTGTKNKGLAGSGLAMPEEATAVANNPASALKTAGKKDLGIALFSPNRSYKTTDSLYNGQGGTFTIGPNDINSSNNIFALPSMAGSWEINDKSAWAVSFYGKGGMNTTWKGGSATFDPDGPGAAPVTTFPGTFGGGIMGNSGVTGVDLMQAYLEFSYAHSIGENFTFGASLMGVMAVFSARGLAAFGGYTETFAASGGTAMPQNLTNNKHDSSYGLGGKIGLLWDVTDTFSFATAYQFKVGMGKFNEYSDLFAEHGSMDIPASMKVGFTFRPKDTFALNFDIEKIKYSGVDSVGNSFSNLFLCPTVNPTASNPAYCLGGNRGPGFGWEDMTIYKIGAQWGGSGDWTWRAGFSHGEQPIPDSEVLFNILAPGVIEDHLTFGFTRDLASGDEFNMSFMWGFNKKVTGTNPLDPSQDISFDMDQWEIEFSYGWR